MRHTRCRQALLTKHSGRVRANLCVACLLDSDVAREIETDKIVSKRARYDASVLNVLRRLYHKVPVIRAVDDGARTFKAITEAAPDVIFNLAFSARPCEADLAGGLRTLGVPFTGSDSYAIALSNDKVRSKIILQAAGIRVPRGLELRPGQRGEIDLVPPLIVKPAFSGSSAGIHSDSLVNNKKDAYEHAQRIWRQFEMAALCEEFIKGREIRISLVERDPDEFVVAGIVEWEFGSAEYGLGFNSESIRSNRRVRQANNVTRHAIKSRTALIRSAISMSERAVLSLGVRGYAAVDVRIDSSGQCYVLEVNANPGLNAASPLWKTPSFERNLKLIVSSALRRGT